MDTENTALSPAPSDKPKLAASVYDWVETFCYAMALMVVLFLLVYRYVTVDGDSMRETLHDSDKLIISGLGYTPETGDIVVVKVPAYQNPIIKRVIATEGQEVEIDFENWTVKVDGVLLEEDYINRDVNYDGVNDDRYVWMASPIGERVLRFTVEPGKLFVMGDNRNHSTDSRSSTVGQVDERQGLGRVMVVGITNVGKSTFINTYTKTKKAKAEDRPGVTREQRWIASPYGVELLDTPGLLWHKFDDPAVGIKLACTGAIRDEILDLYSLSHELLGMLAQSYPALLEARYGIKIAAGDSIGDVFEAIARRRGFLRAGGEIDEERTAAVLLDEFRGGRIGRITLD